MTSPGAGATVMPGRRAAARAATGLVPLTVLWALAFTGTTPFYPTLMLGSAAMVGFAVWVWATGEPRSGTLEVPAPFPPLGLRPRVVWLALVVAVVHYLVGAALFQLASELVPAFAQTASTTYDRAEAVPLWAAAIMGGLVSAPLEEVFWRGAVQPILAGLLTVRWAETGQRPWVAIVATAVLYALFHAATTQLALVAAALLGGLVWGWLLQRTRSLGAVMIAHAVWTTLMLLVPPG